MDAVLVIGRVRAARGSDVAALLAVERPEARVFRQGDTLALLVEGPRAKARFLRLLSTRESTFARIVDCLEDVPLLPAELAPSAE